MANSADKEIWTNFNNINWSKRLNWRNPYFSALSVTEDECLAKKIIFYAYKFPFFFDRSFNLERDLLNEISLNILKHKSTKKFVLDEEINSIARNTVARFLATNLLSLSGYSNIRSYTNRLNKLKKESNYSNAIWDLNSHSEYDNAVETVRSQTYSHSDINEVRIDLELNDNLYSKIALDYIDGYSIKELSELYCISQYEVKKMINLAKEYVDNTIQIRNLISSFL